MLAVALVVCLVLSLARYIKWYQSKGYPLVAVASLNIKPILSIPNTRPRRLPVRNMSSSQTPEQVAEQALRDKADLEAQVKYLSLIHI